MIMSKIFDSIKEAFRDKKSDLNDAQSYRSGDDGSMVGSKEGQWDGSQPEHIQMVDSTCVQNMKYNPKTGDVDIQFRNGDGKTYRYPGVSQEEIDAVRKAASKGRAFWNIIRPHSTNL